MQGCSMKKNAVFSKKIFSFFAVLMISLQVLCAAEFYWENPVAITTVNTMFPRTVSSGNKSYIFWQEIDEKNKKIYITERSYSSLTNYTEARRFAGPIEYTSEVPDLYSVTIMPNGTIAVAVLTNPYEITIFTSTDNGNLFIPQKIKTSEIMVAPRIYATSRNSLVLFTSVGEEDAFNISYSESADGKNWSGFKNFEPSSTCRSPFIPVLTSMPDGKDLVVFQAQHLAAGSNRFSYQLYATFFDPAANTWSQALMLTNENSLSNGETKAFTSYQNQSPSLFTYQDDTYLVWERTESVNSVIKIAEISESGLKSRSTETIANQGSASRGNLFVYDGKLCIVWFDTRRGRESVYMAEKDGSFWEEFSLVENKNSNLFGYPVFINNAENPEKPILSFIWQQTAGNKNTIEMLCPDKTVNIPTFTPLSFKNGKRSLQNDVSIQINFPQDSSNIAGYSYTWTKDRPGNPPKQIQHFTKEKKIVQKATAHGEYYLTVRVQDYAGNWSEPASQMYYLDLVAPKPPVIKLNNVDSNGLVKSNTFQIEWEKSVDDDVAGYSYRIDHISDIPKNLRESKKHPLKISESEVRSEVAKLLTKVQDSVNRNRKIDSKIKTAGQTSVKYHNLDNGVYVFSIAAIDEVGNVGDVSKQVFILNKFEPSTYISSVTKKMDDSGNYILTINGGGFTYDGTVSQIYIDSDGKAPYDLVLEKSKNQYKVQNDSLINNVNIGTELEEGVYKIFLLHTDRGLYKTGNILKIDQTGTLKIESEYLPKNQYSTEFKTYKYSLVINLVIAVLIVVFASIITFFVIETTGHATYEETVKNQEVKAVLKGEKMPMKKLQEKLHPLPSLRRTIIRFTYLLIVVVVLVVTIENASKLVTMQKNTMASGLENRTEVLLESLASGVKNFFPSNNILELSALPGQKDAMSEVKYVTILGQPQDSDSSENLNYVWASNDPDITEKIDTYTFEYGGSQITDPVILEITKNLSDYDEKIRAEVAPISQKISALNDQLMAINNSDNPDKEALLETVSGAQATSRNQLDATLQILAKEGSGSYPFFDTENLDENQFDYIFYRPVTYRHGNSGNYVHGIVYLEVSTKEMIDSLHRELRKIILSGVLIAVIAVILGSLGASVFASMFVKPIRQLEDHVIKIGKTRKKKDIKDIFLKSKDEIGRLGEAINKMTDELKENEIENNLLIDGADVQNSLTPLEKGETFSDYSDEFIKAAAYFQAQTGVSGDYFDFHQLEGDWYCYIKSDASGHGAPAALISTCVAVLYREYFSNWSYKKNGTKINVLVERINDFINNWHLRGKFSTLLIGIYNKKTGDTWMCNAGDNIVHIYRKQTGKVEVIKLKESPTAGPIDTFMVNMKGGFVVEKAHLDPGDILFLYTDGIEEAWRRVRFEDYTVKQDEEKVTTKNPKTGEVEETIKLYDVKEEFGPERVMQIIEAFFHQQKFILQKEDNPNKSEILEFDYSKVEQNLYGVIFALASAEKVFRFYKPQDLEDSEYIEIDKNIDGFLEKCFNDYQNYAGKKQVNPEKPNFLEYPALKEDEQGDDLTLLAIERK